ncbi:MAG: hypothetical protein IT580_15785, partial [Verrucomicrobiales bacterium]|nr:hypothetical protein [Verrucomicrobiales bacterium]
MKFPATCIERWRSAVRRRFQDLAQVQSLGRVRRLRRLCLGLPAALGGITQVNQGMEQRFLGISGKLETLATLSDELVKKSELLLGLAMGQMTGEDLLGQSITGLRTPVDYLTEAQHRSAEIVRRLHEHQRSIRDVCSMEVALQRVIAPLRYIQTFFRVESATLPPDVQTVFASLTAEIDQLHRRVVELFGEQFQNLDQAHRAIAALAKRLETTLHAQQKMVDARKAQIEQAMLELEHTLTESRSTDIRLTKTAHEISNAVGNMVLGLQFQDITRQKLEHIQSAMAQVGTVVGEPGGRHRPTALMRYVNGTSRIQLGQLSGVQEDLRKAQADMVDATSRILAQADGMDGECVTLRGFRSVSVAEDGVVQVVLNTLEEVRALMHSMEEMHGETRRAIQPLGGLASNLTGVIRSLSSNIRLIALNAQVQAAHVGSGTGLEVLSQRTCNISDEASEVNERAAGELDLLTAGFDALVKEGEDLQRLLETAQAWLAGEGTVIEQRLHQFRDGALDVFREVDHLAGELRDQVNQTLGLIEFESLANDHLVPLADALREVVEATRVDAERCRGHEEDELTSLLRSQYTMESERALHESVMR